MKLSILHVRQISGSFVAFAGNVRLGSSNCRTGACGIIRSALRAHYAARRITKLESRIRRARRNAFRDDGGGSMIHVPAMKAEIMALRPRLLCGWDTDRLARIFATL